MKACLYIHVARPRLHLAVLVLILQLHDGNNNINRERKIEFFKKDFETEPILPVFAELNFAILDQNHKK